MVLPARAGMSPRRTADSASRTSAPRASGDEPNKGGNGSHLGKCSPRERG